MGAVALCHCRGKIIKKPKDLGRACYAGAGAGASRYSRSSHWDHLVPILRDGEPTASGCPPFVQHGPQGYLSIRLRVQRGERGFCRNVMLMDPDPQLFRARERIVETCWSDATVASRGFSRALCAPRSLVALLVLCW